MLQVTDLEVRYGRIRALRGVSLQVPDGGAVAVLGANGAGKTSLLRAISRMLKPAAGSVKWDGMELAGLSAHQVVRQGLVHVPEGRAMIAPLSVYENLLMGAYVCPKKEVHARVEQMMELFPALKRRLKIASGQLSGGEQQMLAIARGLMSQPRLIAIDEPSMGLALAVSDVVLNGLRDVNATGTAVLLVEQNAALALRIAKDVVLLSHGEVQRSGPAAELANDVMAAYADT
jgi:branched-chain amino acid transport system ATP-binding protein